MNEKVLKIVIFLNEAILMKSDQERGDKVRSDTVMEKRLNFVKQ